MKTDTILSRAEANVARAYVDGLSGKEIADKLCISYNTVIRHTQNIYDKIGRRSINGMVSWWFCLNFDIQLSEVGRRIGAACLLLLFCTYVIGDNDYVARRMERRTRRNEIELTINIE